MILTVSDLASGYGRIPILHGISFGVAEGESVGIWGHNGMGKTTLLTTILGYQPVTRGRITFAGEDVTRLETHHRARRGIGLVPQGRQIFSALTVAENLRMGSAVSGRQEDGVTEEILELFPRLKPLLPRIGGLLSGGEQQLLALARCLCGRPKIMMLDEPTEGIQPSINEEILETLIELRNRRRLTLIVVEQRREFIAALADRVLIMQKGAISGELPPSELLGMEELH
ncbi:Aputative ABC superfamily ATP binding cassette transporter, ABC protein (plasmid) [Sinorhizobium fredii HH103]|uniref:Aputative ABC superfamily ATP binding cassette transporter, ABC protein n=1 Tax=Sinorhizobium fredii (strain HH103) TaxID=1117943 RepID=G9AIT3_SINF1|nr:ATP-binding cassette domain-containing protein [Sinorhizobium fredii]CCF00965.1 Aputative ABC superfamily ATP binding cassette transporter, ABC protein [Sinorhizobium fredii HH103]